MRLSKFTTLSIGVSYVRSKSLNFEPDQRKLLASFFAHVYEDVFVMIKSKHKTCLGTDWNYLCF